MNTQGEIEFLHCFATLKTKSQTKFYIEFHSSCLESKGLPILIPSVKVPCLWTDFLSSCFDLNKQLGRSRQKKRDVLEMCHILQVILYYPSC